MKTNRDFVNKLFSGISRSIPAQDMEITIEQEQIYLAETTTQGKTTICMNLREPDG